MATVGQPLTAPEAGWRRYDDTDSNISHKGTWATRIASGMYGGSNLYSNDADSTISFNFSGNRLRIISNSYSTRVPTIVTVDGVIYTFNAYSSNSSLTNSQILQFELTDLSASEHSVVISNDSTFIQGTSALTIDALDIAENGELLPFNPKPEDSGQALLRVTVIDSSDHDYLLSSTEIDGFVNWFMKHTNADTAGYLLTKKTGTQNSKEYLAFDKIISFEVIPVA